MKRLSNITRILFLQHRSEKCSTEEWQGYSEGDPSNLTIFNTISSWIKFM